MSSLKVHDLGLQLEGIGEVDELSAPPPIQAIPIALDDATLELLIQSFQNGEGLELKLGKNPVRCYRPSLVYVSNY